MSKHELTIEVQLSEEEEKLLADSVDGETPPYTADPSEWDHLGDVNDALDLAGIEASAVQITDWRKAG